MEEELTQSEIDQMRKFATLQKVALCILRKWLWLFIVIFSVAAVVFSVFLVRHTAKSGHRFVTTTQLLYNPRQVAHIQNMSDKQLMSIIDRKSIKRRVGDVMLMERSEKECLTIDLEVKQEKHPSNLFTLTATGPTLAQAARKVNSYAELIIGEYVSYRTRDLDNWRGSLNVRRETLQKQISEVESEENTLKAQSGVVAPIETLTMVNGLLSDQRRNLSMLTVQITNEETKQHKFEAKVGKVGRAVSENAGVIRKKSEEISALNKEIALLRERYTDKNPKVIGKLDELKALLESYTGFLKEKGIDGVDLNSIDQLEKVASDLAETMLRLDALHESRRSLESEIASNEKRAETLTGIIPAFDRLRVRRADLEQAMRDLDEQVDNISYLQMSVRSDLRQIERAAGADDKNPFRIKYFAIAFAAAVVGTIGLSMMILILEFAAGHTVDGRDRLCRARCASRLYAFLLLRAGLRTLPGGCGFRCLRLYLFLCLRVRACLTGCVLRASGQRQ